MRSKENRKAFWGAFLLIFYALWLMLIMTVLVLEDTGMLNKVVELIEQRG